MFHISERDFHTMHIVHVALQGCLRGSDIEYGITADTGGHIRYLLELVEASEQDPAIERITLVTRAFESDFSAVDYTCLQEVLNDRVTLVRLATDNPNYLPKEQLYQELPAFMDAFEQWLKMQPQLPDALHAHYADAGEVAAEMQTRLGIPFVFTAHSLGRSKIKCLQHRAAPCDDAATQALTRRIAFEARAIREAGLIIASSRDEAEVQYADYPDYDAGRIRVIPPGSHLSAFTEATSTPCVDAMLGRFLTDPNKPALLAIARPVTRKNLAALVHAFGNSPALRDRANLIIVAGVRERIDHLEPELADNLRELLALIDDYDLYGKVAYPRHHREEDIPALYAWARERGGIFINPALNEPFGLTLLEASAAGLPLVATDSGGPNDIIEQCGNGILINPRHTERMAGEMLALLNDPPRWQRMADNGHQAVLAFDWQREAIARALEDFPGLTPQGPLEQRRHKLSYFSDGDTRLSARVQRYLQQRGLACTVIHSHGRYFDILPIDASKGLAVEHVRQRFNIPARQLYVAGDSGNDLDMLRSTPCSIVVANYSDGLLDAPGMRHAYAASAAHALGIIEGVQHFQQQYQSREMAS